MGVPSKRKLAGPTRIIAIATEKGGVGKTTTAVNLCAGLAEMHYRVLAIDMDGGGGMTRVIGIPMDNNESVYHLLQGEKTAPEVSWEWNDFLVWPSTGQLASFPVEIVDKMGRELFLRRALSTIKDEYDFVIIDSPPTLDLLTINGLTAATDVIVPLEASYLSMEGLGGVLGTIEGVREFYNPDLWILGFLLTRVNSQKKLVAQVKDSMVAEFGKAVFNIMVRNNVKVEEAPGFHQSIFTYDPDGRGSYDYHKLAEETVRRIKQ